MFLAEIFRYTQIFKGSFHPTMKIMSSFTRPGVVLMQYDLLSFSDHRPTTEDRPKKTNSQGQDFL